MTLPSAQQRVLDVIADRLRSSEPKLVAKFAIFTRLSAGEAPPNREQLAGGNGRLASFRGWAGTKQGRSTFRQLLATGQVAIAFVLIAVLLSVGLRGAVTSCGAPSHRSAVIQPRAWCSMPVSPGLAGK